MRGWFPTGRVVNGKPVFEPFDETPSESYLWHTGKMVEIGVRQRFELVAARRRNTDIRWHAAVVMIPLPFIKVDFDKWWWKV